MKDEIKKKDDGSEREKRKRRGETKLKTNTEKTIR